MLQPGSAPSICLGGIEPPRLCAQLYPCHREQRADCRLHTSPSTAKNATITPKYTYGHAAQERQRRHKRRRKRRSGGASARFMASNSMQTLINSRFPRKANVGASVKGRSTATKVERPTTTTSHRPLSIVTDESSKSMFVMRDPPPGLCPPLPGRSAAPQAPDHRFHHHRRRHNLQQLTATRQAAPPAAKRPAAGRA
jgi:hypothetical protein